MILRSLLDDEDTFMENMTYEASKQRRIGNFYKVFYIWENNWHAHANDGFQHLYDYFDLEGLEKMTNSIDWVSVEGTKYADFILSNLCKGIARLILDYYISDDESLNVLKGIKNDFDFTYHFQKEIDEIKQMFPLDESQLPDLKCYLYFDRKYLQFIMKHVGFFKIQIIFDKIEKEPI